MRQLRQGKYLKTKAPGRRGKAGPACNKRGIPTLSRDRLGLTLE